MTHKDPSPTQADFEAAGRMLGLGPISRDDLHEFEHSVAVELEALALQHAAGRVTSLRPRTARKRPRTPTLAAALKQAAKANKPVKAATLNSDGVKLEFGETEEASNNPWLADLRTAKQ